MSSPPFIDPETGALDGGQIRNEVFPLAALVVLFGALALLVFLVPLLLTGESVIGLIASQFVIAVGVGMVLLYVVARGIQLAEE